MRGVDLIAEEGQAPQALDGIDLEALFLRLGENDPGLVEARIVLAEPEEESLEVNAVEGLWCLALFGDQVDSAHYFALWDTEDRMRIWLFLPPVRPMIGLAHLWLRSVPPSTKLHLDRGRLALPSASLTLSCRTQHQTVTPEVAGSSRRGQRT